MALSRIYVSGSYLMWESGSAQYRAQGALPSPSVFAGQAAGRVWVAKATTDEFLYYSDSTGTTRFLQGIDRGAALLSNQEGQVYANQGICPTTSGSYSPQWNQLFWITSASTGLVKRSFRGEGIPSSVLSSLDVYFTWAGNGSNSVGVVVSTPMKESLTINGLTVTLYDDGACTNQIGAANRTLPAVTLLPGYFTTYSYSNISTTPVALSLRLNSASMTVNGIIRRNDNDTFCNTYDLIYPTTVTPKTTATTGCWGITVAKTCGDACTPSVSDTDITCPPECTYCYAAGGSLCTATPPTTGQQVADCGDYCDWATTNNGTFSVDGCNGSSCPTCTDGADISGGLYEEGKNYCN